MQRRRAATTPRNEIIKILRHFGCEEIALMDNFDQHEVLLAFKHRGRAVQLKASAKAGLSYTFGKIPGRQTAAVRDRLGAERAAAGPNRG